MSQQLTSKASIFLAGFIFAIGLGVSGMTSPAKVIAFLNLAGDWDPSLAFVMGGAIVVHGVLFRLITRRSAPLFARRFYIPTRRDLTPRLVIGSTMFGFGWAVGGYCPGPSVVSVVSLTPSALVFVAAMITGMYGFGLVETQLQHNRRMTTDSTGSPSH